MRSLLNETKGEGIYIRPYTVVWEAGDTKALGERLQDHRVQSTRETEHAQAFQEN